MKSITLFFSVPLLIDATRQYLENIAISRFHGLLWCTAAVTVGVILDELDFFAPIKYIIDGQTGLPRARFKFDRLRPWLIRLGFWLLIMGLVGEGIFEFLGSRANDRLREFDSSLLSAFQGQVARANERAGIAMKEAAILESVNLRLYTAIQRRDLSPAQQRAIANSLRKYSGEFARVAMYAFDGDGVLLAKELWTMLPMAGIRFAGDVQTTVPGNNPVFGVWISGPKSKERFMEAIRDALRDKENLSVAIGPAPRAMETDAVVIFVGLRPLVK